MVNKKAAKKKVAKKKVAKRTKAGTIKPKVRDRTATLSDDRFPIFDEKSASAALRLRGHGTTPAERKKIVAKAAKYCPEKAKKAREADRKKGGA